MLEGGGGGGVGRFQKMKFVIPLTQVTLKSSIVHYTPKIRYMQEINIEV